MARPDEQPGFPVVGSNLGPMYPPVLTDAERQRHFPELDAPAVEDDPLPLAAGVPVPPLAGTPPRARRQRGAKKGRSR